jgi:hypothetical protein
MPPLQLHTHQWHQRHPPRPVPCSTLSLHPSPCSCSSHSSSRLHTCSSACHAFLHSATAYVSVFVSASVSLFEVHKFPAPVPPTFRQMMSWWSTSLPSTPTPSSRTPHSLAPCSAGNTPARTRELHRAWGGGGLHPRFPLPLHPLLLRLLRLLPDLTFTHLHHPLHHG